MNTNGKIEGTDEVWDKRTLGADMSFAELVQQSAEDEQTIDAALDLQPISIRLQKSMIEDYKLLASLSGLGYQPLMRQVLSRWADSEKKRILREVAGAAAKRKAEESGGQDETVEKTKGQ